MASEEKINKINELIKRELGALIIRELEFPSGVVVTITSVKTTSDTAESKIGVSVFPSIQSLVALRVLQNAAGYLQHLLIRKIRMHFVPRIVFKADKEMDQALQVEAILEKVKMENEE